MHSARSQRSHKSVTAAIFQKEHTMNRLFITLLSTLIVALFALNASPALAQDSTPGSVDADDAAYLQEYQQRAAEKYQALKTAQATQVAAAQPDWGGEMAVREYNQRSRAVYAAVQQRSRPAVVYSTPDWGGELFLAEYEQRGQERYRVWLAQQNSRLTGSTSP